MTLEQILEKYRGAIPTPIISVAKDLGVEVYETDEFDDSISGSISKNSSGVFTIYVNAKHSPNRKRFTVAHEIGHFLRHQEALGKEDEHIDSIKQPIQAMEGQLYRKNAIECSVAERQMEIEANEVAADLLMPREAFINIWKLSSNIEEVADKFKVSSSAAAIRAKVLTGETFM